MSFQEPRGRCQTTIQGLGELHGFEYENGVQQYCGIPYASLPKRWTRSTLKTSWENAAHDGTKLGNSCPHPLTEGDDVDALVPVPPSPHFSTAPQVDEISALVMNLVIPSAPHLHRSRSPVLVYVHGGSLLYGGANLPIFDSVNLVSHSVSIGSPIVCVNFNYRVGLGGFLASSTIKAELARDGHQGCGNFGFTDQQVAFDWVQTYISDLGGDPDNVTAVGESAGGISISNQMAAATPPVFKRAACMSGLSVAIPAWTMDEHEQLFSATCHHFGLDPAQEDVLDRLRAIPQQELANATPTIQGVPSGTGNPCLDDWFYERDPRQLQPLPAWLQSYMIGDVYHEGVIFHINLIEESYDSIARKLQDYVGSKRETVDILEAYGILADIDHDLLLDRVEHMCGDAIFKVPNYALASTHQVHPCPNTALYTYHFDQRSRIKNVFEGTAYHAHELLYLFGNLRNEFNDAERSMSADFMTTWIKFVHDEEPWPSSDGEWKVWGPDSVQRVKSTTEDEHVRLYSRMDRVLAMGNGETWKKWLRGIDALVNQR